MKTEEILALIDAEIAVLKQARALLAVVTPVKGPAAAKKAKVAAKAPGKRRKMSAETRQRWQRSEKALGCDIEEEAKLGGAVSSTYSLLRPHARTLCSNSASVASSRLATRHETAKVIQGREVGVAGSGADAGGAVVAEEVDRPGVAVVLDVEQDPRHGSPA